MLFSQQEYLHVVSYDIIQFICNIFEYFNHNKVLAYSTHEHPPCHPGLCVDGTFGEVNRKSFSVQQYTRVVPLLKRKHSSCFLSWVAPSYDKQEGSNHQQEMRRPRHPYAGPDAYVFWKNFSGVTSHYAP